jgi:hypothetical protein
MIKKGIICNTESTSDRLAIIISMIINMISMIISMISMIINMISMISG